MHLGVCVKLYEGSKILVTGALGQIGTDLTEALRKKYGQNNVIATDIRTIENHPSVKNGIFQNLDVMETQKLIEICRNNDIGTIYHLAALLSAVGEKNPEKCRKINIDGTISILEAARICSLRVFSPSSIAVFGPDCPSHASQSSPLNPTTVYGQTKAIGEKLAREYWEIHGVDTRGIRYPGLISYKSPPGGGTTDYAVEIFHSAINHGHYEFFVEPNTTLPMLYMDDAIRATLSLMDSPSESLGIFRSGYNVSGITFTAQELASKIEERIEGFKYSFVPDHRQKIADSWPDSIDDSISRKEWNWSPQFDLDSMVDAMFEGIENT